MIELFRDTAIGHLIRWASHGKLLSHAEDIDPTLWRMYISTEKSTTLQHLVIKNTHKSHSNGGMQLQILSGNSTPATRAKEEHSATEEQTPAPQPENYAVRKSAQANDKSQLPSPKSAEIPQTAIKLESASVFDTNSLHFGGNTGKAGTWSSEEIQQAFANDKTAPALRSSEEIQQAFVNDKTSQRWGGTDTPQTWSNAETPRNTSSTALLSMAGSTANATPQNEKLEQGWTTAAIGQDRTNVSMQEGQVDGNPALQWHSENSETTWNAVQLEAGGATNASAKEAAADPTAERVVNVVVWLGPNDPANPLNWSHGKRAFVTAQIYLLTICTYIGTSIFSPGSQDVQKHFGVGGVAATLGTSLAILGYGLGVMIWSPMSEAIRIGRKPVYLVTLTVFVGLQVPTALAKNFGMLLAFRFLSGIFGAPVLAIGGASINDMYTPTQRGYAIVLWDVVSVAAPVLGPLIGGFAAAAKGWTWTIWQLMWLSGASLLFFILFMPETNQSNILYRRSRRLRILTGNKTLRSEQDILGGSMNLWETLHRLFARPFVLCFTEPILLVINVYVALLNAILFGSLDSFPLVFNGVYGFNLGEVGLAFIGLFVGSVLALPPMFYYLRYLLVPNAFGEIRPEKRLPPAMVGAFLVPVSLLMFGWTARASVHWIAPIVASGFFGIAIVTISYASLNYLPDAYPSCAASVLAGNEFMRSTASAIFPLFTTAMYNRLGIGWASSLLGFLSCVFIPVPIVLYYHGHTIRSWSKRAKQDF